MEKSNSKPRSPKPAGPPKNIEIDDDSVEIYERIAAVDDAMQRMRKRLETMETELEELQALLIAEEKARAASKSGK